MSQLSNFELTKLVTELAQRVKTLENEIELIKAKPKRKTFKPPEVREVSEYMFEIGSHAAVMESEKFCDFYASKGWLVGKAKMKDWKAAARQWIKRQNNQQSLAIAPPVTQKQQVRTALRNINGTDW